MSEREKLHRFLHEERGRQTALAEKSGIRTSHLSKIANGRRGMSATVALRLSAAAHDLGCEIDGLRLMAELERLATPAPS